MFKALAEPTRRTILDELADRDDQTLFEICARLVTRQAWRRLVRRSPSTSTCSRRPVYLTRREGRYKFHSIEREPLRHLADPWLDERS